MINRMYNWLLKELTLKIDFKNDEYEIGFVWLFWLFMVGVSYLLEFISWLLV